MAYLAYHMMPNFVTVSKMCSSWGCIGLLSGRSQLRPKETGRARPFRDDESVLNSRSGGPEQGEIMSRLLRF